ncbi:MAG: SPFH domain-containing protein [bacterium]|nr:SPFH domain-containing protein [bacterium]
MGLIKAAAAAVGSTLHDQWKEYIRCDDLGQDILMKRVSTPNGVISKDSAIQVAPGQIAVVFQNGQILDATAEEGIFTFDQSTSPSFFAGQFGAVFKEMWGRFTYNGGTFKEQAVFYINAKEIMDNKFGTPAPIPFQDWSHPIPNQMTGAISPLRVEVKCFGKYTFKISDPAVFMSRVAGTAEEYRKDELCEQMRSEVIGAFQNVLNELGNSEHKTPVLELPSSTDEIKQVMDEKVFDQPIRDRGLNIVGFVVESVTLDDESNQKIDNYELSSNQFMQQGTLTGAYANAVQDAAKNEAGAMNGFLGVGMMNMASGGMMGGVAANAVNPQINPGNTQAYDPYANQAAEQLNQARAVAANAQAQATAVQNTNFCPNCGNPTSGSNFCPNCGTKLK